MHPLLRETKKIIVKEALLSPGSRVVVAVSGGPDSVALLYVLSALAPELGISLKIAHLDHGLRGEESLSDAESVRRHAERLLIPLVTEKVEVREQALRTGRSVEHAARILRYDFLARAAGEFQAQAIAVGHTADDQAEEVLLRLIRGTGAAGLSGMNIGKDTRIIRPFLHFPKSMLLSYLRQQGISFVTDSSNLDRQYLRNRVRLDLLPYLATHYNPNIRKTLIHTAAILKDEDVLLSELTLQAQKTVFIQKKGKTGLSGDPPRVELAIAALLAQPRAIQRRLLEAVFWQMAQRPGFRQIEQLLSIARGGDIGKRVHLSSGLRAARIADRLVFSYPQGMKAGRGDLVYPPTKTYAVRVETPGNTPVPELGRTFEFRAIEYQPAQKLEPGAEYLDLDLLSFPLLIRPIEKGDRFHPLGAPGPKKVSDFLINCKIPRKRRCEVPILVSAGKIAALIGLRIDNCFRLTTATRKALEVRIGPGEGSLPGDQKDEVFPPDGNDLYG